LTWFRNFRNADSRFLYYWFLSPDAKHQIDTKCIGSTQKALTIETLLKFIIPLPPLTTQRAIAGTLSCLDEKIELNNHINANLEAQAQAIFKSWFVDFEPFKDGKFVDSELGRIPKGWRVGTLSDLVNIKYGKAHQSLDNGIVPVYGSGGLLRYAEKYLYDKESVLIPRKGTLNNVMYIKEPFWVVDTMFYTEIKHPHVLFFVYQFLKNKDLASMNTGTAVPSMTIEILNSLLTIVPNDDVLYNYNKTVSILYDQIIMNIRQSHILADIRDALMPKLMSGEVEVEE
jgi:type I restriction enzyme S subunit